MKTSDWKIENCDVGPGWHPLVNLLIERCKSSNTTITQVKEKWGGLRFYVGPHEDFLEGMIVLAENISYTICEQCGNPGSTEGSKSWIKTLCKDCRKQDDNNRIS